MTKAYQSQNIFFAFGVLCTLTLYDGKLCAAVIGYSSAEALSLLDETDFEAILVTKDEQVLTTQGLSQKQQIAA